MKKNIVIIILSVLLICLGGYLIYDKLSTKENKNKETNLEKEVEITDITLKKNLTNSVESINNVSLRYKQIDFDFYTAHMKQLSEYDKLFIASTLIGYDKLTPITVKKEDISYDFITVGDNYNQIKQLLPIEIEKVYYSLFGEKPLNHQNVGNCPRFIYDSKNNVYYYHDGCGGGPGDFIDFYIHKYTSDTNNIYVYVNYALGKRNYESSSNLSYNIYNDIDKNSMLYKQDVENFDINESNYKDFAEYKFTFKKSNEGNYYFEEIERVK